METLILRHRAKRLLREAVFKRAKEGKYVEYMQLRARAVRLYGLAQEVENIVEGA